MFFFLNKIEISVIYFKYFLIYSQSKIFYNTFPPKKNCVHTWWDHSLLFSRNCAHCLCCVCFCTLLVSLNSQHVLRPSSNVQCFIRRLEPLWFPQICSLTWVLCWHSVIAFIILSIVWNTTGRGFCLWLDSWMDINTLL